MFTIKDIIGRFSYVTNLTKAFYDSVSKKLPKLKIGAVCNVIAKCRYI